MTITFDDVDKSLTVLDNNIITTIGDIQHERQPFIVKKLIINRCRNLVSLNGLQNYYSLQYLSVNNCGLADIQELSHDNVQDIQHLDLSQNSIVDLKPLQYLIQLKYLNLSSNRVLSAEQSIYLALMEELQHLHFGNNPVSTENDFRQKLFYVLPLDIKTIYVAEAPLLNFADELKLAKDVISPFEKETIEQNAAALMVELQKVQEDINRIEVEVNDIHKTTQRSIKATQEIKDLVHGGLAITDIVQ